MQLPKHYLITPTTKNKGDFLTALEHSLQAGTRLIQLKGKGMDVQEYTELARLVVNMAHNYDCKVLLTGEPALVEQLGADGLHLDSKALEAASSRLLPEDYLVAVSGHTLEALKQGEAIGASFGVLSPIKYTNAHPDIEPIGWEGLTTIVAQLAMPVYALGGVSAKDESEAIKSGAQGIAGSRGYWEE